MGVWYCTREDVQRELDVKETARSAREIDRKIESASRLIEELTHRRFYPERDTRRFDWPNGQYARAWRLWLDSNELISVDSLMTGGVTVSPTSFFLRRSDDLDEPPYTSLELDIGTSAAFGGGSTHQRDITITGVWGYRDDETTLGVTAEALDASETGVDVDGATSAEVGVGSVIRVGDERMTVVGRVQLATGQTLGAGLAAQANATTVTVADGTVFAVDEVILVDGERMRVDDIAGNTLVVRRGWDGSTLAAHTLGAGIYAPRSLRVTRGALGTTAATHTSGASVARWDPPGPVHELCVAEAVSALLQGRAGWARTSGSGEHQRETFGRGLAVLRDQVYVSHGRKARIRAV